MPKHEVPDEHAAVSDGETSEREPANDLREEELTDVVGGTKSITLDVEALASIEEVTKTTGA
jgi:hypothetical protein